MEREEAYNAAQPAPTTGAADVESLPDSAELSTLARKSPDLRYNYRHGDGRAEILNVEVLNASRETADLVESGDALTISLRVRMHRDIVHPVFGFLIRDRHGVHAYGVNTEQKGLTFDRVERGEIVEVTFSFDCWLGTDLYSVSVAVHSEDGASYDWLDGVHFFRVASPIPLEGIANLNATVGSRRLGQVTGPANHEGGEDTAVANRRVKAESL
jgi:Wzt-like putative exopolysaccharide export protein